MRPILTGFNAMNLHVTDMEFFGKRFQGGFASRQLLSNQKYLIWRKFKLADRCFSVGV
jgi:hypothetical protein